MDRMPALFVAHGAPPLLEDAVWMRQLQDWGQALPRPKAILVVSAHWITERVTIGATSQIPLVYDFYGFPKHFYEIEYPAPGAPKLAQRVRELAAAAGIPVEDEPTRGLDHGVWTPLIPMFPRAEIPVLQLSMPGLEPEPLVALGRMLRPLRDEGVLIVGSGFLVHNLGELNFRSVDGPPYAKTFDAWTADALDRGDLDGLMRYRTDAPDTRRAHPTVEHFVPVFVTAAAGAGDPVSYPITGFRWGPFSKRSVQMG